MQLTVTFTATIEKQLVALAKEINQAPEQVCVLFISDGVNSYKNANDIAELIESLDAQP